MVAFTMGYLVITDPNLGWNFIWIPFATLSSIAVFQFLTLKNELTQSNSYSLWTYSCLLLIAALYATDISIFIAYLFCLLALNRLLSMRTGRGLVKKIFDASLWIAIATLFYSWCSLFFLVVFLSIVVYNFKNVKYWTIPFIAISCVTLLTFTVDQLLETVYLFPVYDGFDYDFNYLHTKWSVSTIVSILLGGIAFLFSIAILFAFPNISLSARSRFSVLGFSGLCSVVIGAFCGSVFFLLPVLAVFLARFLQETNDKITKESLLWLPFITMFILFFIRL
ncbi:MAG: hypothetical protein ACI9WL_000670 [Rubritalea sp.]|jgi:hypothetical protein